MRPHEVGVAQKVTNGTVKRHAPVLKRHYPTGHTGQGVGVVACNHNSCPVISRRANRRKTVLARTRVKSRRGLVEKKQTGAHREYGGNGNASLLAAGERKRRAPAQLIERKAQKPKGMGGPTSCLARRNATREQAKAHLSLNRGLKELTLRNLEDKPYLTRKTSYRVTMKRITSVHEKTPRIRSKRTGKHLQQR